MKMALEAGLILLREGLEALLIVTALAAAMRRAGAHERVRALYIGAVLAIFASLAAAWVFQLYFDGTHDDRIEAVVIFIAATLMLYMSGWLFLRQDPQKWKAEITRMSGDALTAGTGFSLGLISFLAVFREGAETVLFLYALASTNSGTPVELISGLVVAAAILGFIFVAMQWLAMQVPVRPLFIVTSAFLFFMGLRFIGAGMQELQEQTIIPYTFSPVPDWLTAITGNPSWEAIGTQLAIGIIALVGILVLSGKRQPA